MVQFSTDDLRTPESLERVLRQFQSALATAPTPPPMAKLDYNAIAQDLAPFIRDQLQSPGKTPLNLQSLLPAIGNSVLLVGTHSDRITLYPPSNYTAGTAFYETDRTVIYVVVNSSGSLVWQYAAGTYTASFSNRPVDLSTNDRGFTLWVTSYDHICIWSGAGWSIIDGGGGYFVDSAFALGAGYQVCDGTATTYLTISGADLAETAFTTPDEVTAPSGVYHKSIAAYTGVINAASAGAISGNTADTTAVNITTSTGVTVDAHSVTQTAQNGTDEWVFEDEAAAAHTVNDPGHNHTQVAHNHAAGTLAVAATGEPRNLGVIRYFRR